MRLTTKWQFIVGTFTLCWMSYFLVPCIGFEVYSAGISDFFDSEAFNFVFLTMLFLTVSVLSADAAEAVYLRIRRFPWFRPRLGEVLVARGFISHAELDEALSEQKLRIGDVLLQAGKVDSGELEKALDYQRSFQGIRVGEVLVKHGYVTKEDVFWALQRSNRKLGRILIERGLITEYDLHRILGRMWYGRNHGL